MTDIRRTLLWGIFLASLFFIWESWNRHTGQPTMFGLPPASRVAAPAPTVPSTVPSATPTASASAGVTATAAAVGAAPSAAVVATPVSPPVASQEVTVTTDLVRASLDSIGGTLFRVELLQQVDQLDHT